MSNRAENMLKRIANVQKSGGKDRLGIGRHRLALVSFGMVKNQQGGKAGPERLVVEVEVQESTNPGYQSGMKRSISFFILRPEYPSYEEERAQALIEAVGACLGDTRGVEAVGADMFSGELCRGVVLDCLVEGEVDENGQPKGGKSGQYTNETWVPIPQSREQVAEAKADLDQRYSNKTPVEDDEPAQQAQAQTQAKPLTQGAPAGWGSPAAGTGSLLKKKS